MKKLLVLAALSMAAAPAMASKARLTALGNEASLIDVQTMFVNPADLMFVGDMATLEFGGADSTAATATVAATPKAEGGFTKTLSWGKVGAYLGHQDATATAFVNIMNGAFQAGGGAANAMLVEQNPLDLFYGTDMAGMKWGFGIHYSNAKKEAPLTGATVTQEENTAGFSVGVRNDVWNAGLRVGVAGTTKSDTAGTPELKEKGLYNLVGGYWFDTIYAFANVLTAKGTLTAGGADSDITANSYEVGMTNNHKLEAGNFFYGISYLNTSAKLEPTGTSKELTESALPFLIGFEVDAASWLTLRGSVKQSVFVNDTKNELTVANGQKTHMINDTVVAAGAGLKFGKLMVDSTISAASNGRFLSINNGSASDTELLANMSMTYMF